MTHGTPWPVRPFNSYSASQSSIFLFLPSKSSFPR